MADVRLEFHADITKSTEALTKELDSIIQDVEKKISPIKLKFDTTEIKATIESVQSTIKETTARASQIITPNSTTYNNALKSLEDDLASVIKKQRDWSVASRDSSEAVSDAFKNLQHQEQVIREMIASLDGLKAANNTVTISVADFREQQSRYREAISSTSVVLEEASKKSKILSQSMNPDAYASALAKVDELMRKLNAARDTALSSNYAQQSPEGMRDLQYYIEQLDALRTKVVAETMSQKEFTASLTEISASSKTVTTNIADYAKSLEAVKNANIASGTTEYSNALAALEKELETVTSRLSAWSAASVSQSDSAREAYDALSSQKLAISQILEYFRKYESQTGVTVMSVDEFKEHQAKFNEEMQKASRIIEEASAKSELLSQKLNPQAYEAAVSKIDKLSNSLEQARTLSTDISFGSVSPEGSKALQEYIDRLSQLRERLESGYLSQQEFKAELDAISSGSNNVVSSIKEYAGSLEQVKKSNISAGTAEFDNALRTLNADLESVRQKLEAWNAATVSTKQDARDAYSSLANQAKAIEDMIKELESYRDKNGEAAMSVETFTKRQAEYRAAIQASSTVLGELSEKSKILSSSTDPVAYANAIKDITLLTRELAQAQETASKVNFGATNPQTLNDLQRYIDMLGEIKSALESGTLSQKEYVEMFGEVSAQAKVASDAVKRYAASTKEWQQGNIISGTAEYAKAIRSLYADLEKVTVKIRDWSAASESNDDRIKSAYSSMIAQKDAISALITELLQFVDANGEATMSVEEFTRRQAEYQNSIQKSSALLEQFGQKSKLLSKDLNSAEYAQALSKIIDLQRQATGAMSIADATPGNAGRATLAQYILTIDELRRKLESGKMSQEEFNEAFRKISANVKIAIDSVKEYADSTKAFNENMDKSNELMMKAIEAQTKYSSMRNSGNQYYGGLSQNIAELTELSRRLREGTISEEEFQARVEQVTKSIEINTVGLQNSATGLQRIGQQIGGLFSGFTNFGNGLTQYITMMFSAYRIIYQVINGVKNLINRSIELEDVMVDLRIVTGLTNDEYTQYLHNISEVSKETATSLDSLITATTTFSRLGYSIEESSVLAKYTGMLEKVGSIDSARAQEAITSIMKAFSDELGVGNIEQVMDKLVAVGNNFPISVEQVSEGMLNASSALAAAGNSFEESVALLTAANTTIQNASKSSTGLRTIAARLRNTKSELDALGEEVLTKAKYDEIVQALTKYKVSLTDLNGEYRSTYDIIQDIANIWGDLSSMEQAALATEISGTRQQAVFFSLVEQFQEASGAMDKMAKSSNTLKDAYSAYTDSMSAHIEQFHTAWSQLAMDLVSSDLVKGVVDVGTKLVGIIDYLARIKAILPTILTLVTALQARRLANTLAQSQQALNGIITSLRSTKTVTDATAMAVAGLNNNERVRLAAMIQQEIQQGKLTAAQGQAIVSDLNLAAANTAVTGTTKAATTATLGFGASLKALWASNPLGLFLTLASTLASVVSIFGSFSGNGAGASDEIEETAKSVKELSESTQELYESTKQTEASMREILPRFKELKKGVNIFGENISLTDTQYAEFLDLQNQIAEKFPELDAGLDKNGNHMLKISANAEILNGELERQLEVRRRLAEMDASKNLDDAWNQGTSNVLYQDNKNGMYALQNYYDILQRNRGYNVREMTSSYRDAVSKYLPQVIAAVGEDVANEMRKAAEITADEIGDDGDPLMLAFQKAQNRINEHLKAFRFTNEEDKEEVRKMLLSWAQLTPEFAEVGTQIGDGFQQIVSNIILDIDPSKFGTANAAQEYIKKNILDVFTDMKPQAQAAISDFMDASDAFQEGKTSAWDYREAIMGLQRALREAGVEIETEQMILQGFGVDDFYQKFSLMTLKIKGNLSDVNEYMKSLSADEFTIAYNIIATNGSMSLDELKLKVEQVKLETGGLVDTLDMTEFFEKTKNLRSGMKTIATAMKKLTEGTALTKSEMMKLAEQFPMLLKQSNLFTDGSIEGQKKMLKSVQDVQKKAYQAVVDAKVAELKASKEAINSQIDLEKKKVEVLLEAETALIKDKLEGNIKYERAMAKIDEIEATNFAEIKNGEVLVNNQGLQAMADSTAQTSEQLLGNVWIPYAEGMVSTIGGAYEIMVDAAKDAYEAITAAILTGTDEDVGSASSAVMLARAKDGDQEALDNLRSGVWKLSDKAAEIFKNSLNKQISLGRIKVLEGAVIDIDNIIANLEASLEDLTYTFSDASASMGSSSGSSSYSSSSNDPESRYNSAIEALVAYRVKMFRAELEAQKKELENQKSLAKKFYDYQKSLVDRQYKEDKYRKEQEEKRKDITDIQMEMDRLQKDNSAWAQGRLVELAEKLTEAQDKLEEFEEKEAVEFWKGYWDDMYKAEEDRIAGEVQSINDILSDNTDFYQRAYSELRSGTTKFANTIFEYAQKNETSMDSFYKMFSNVYDALLALQKEDNSTIVGDGTSWWWTGDGLRWLYDLITNPHNYPFSGAKYASGTSYATPGWHRVNEVGAEMLFTSADGKQYRLFSGGERVLDADSTSFLYALAKTKGGSLAGAISQSYRNVTARTTPTNITMGNIIINGNADERTVSEIRRAQRDSVSALLREFTRLAR